MVNSKDFAALAGVSKPAVAQAIKAGKLLRGVDGLLDETAALNARYIKEQAEKRKFAAYIRSPESSRAFRQTEAKRAAAPTPAPSESFLRIEGDFGEGFRAIVEYHFSPDDLELGTLHFSIPTNVEIDHVDGPEAVHVRRVDTGEAIPVRLVNSGDGQALARRGRA